MSDNHDRKEADADPALALVAARLFAAGPSITPPPSVWAAIQADLDADLATIDRMHEGVWATTGDGIRTKLLWGGSSLLIQCDIGAIIPEHEHFGEERIMVISGDMIISGQSYGAGDTLTMPKGSYPGPTTTKTGCLILISYVN
jgi:ChrR Cupin-like domain